MPRFSTASRAIIAAGCVLALGGAVARSLLAGLQAGPSGGTGPALLPSERGRLVPRVWTALRVSSVTGPVERRPRPGDPWRPVHPGEAIAPNESLRTGSGGAAVLELQDHTTIWLWPESEVSAERLDDELSRVGVEGGRLDLQVPLRDERSIEVGARGGATASTHGARFSVVVDGARVATIATREGEVDVVNGSQHVRVPPGMQTRARPGAAPERAVPIPTDLLLEVDWPATVLRSHSVALRGRAPPGVLLSVNGVRVVVEADGAFTAPVALAEGDNHVEVTAEDVVGHRTTRRSPPLQVDTRPPVVGAHGRWQ
jgi:hypothetical protein